MNGYELSRRWFDFCFENPEKIKPTHTAIYFFAIEHCNRLGWKKKFGLPSSMAMEAIGVKSYNTYIKALNEIVEWGFIKMIEKSRNQYSSNIIALSKFDKALDKALVKALDKALIKHTSKQSESTVQSIDSIDKQLTNKQINNKQENVKNSPAIDILKKEKQSELDVLWMQNKTQIPDAKKLIDSFNAKMELEIAQGKISFDSKELMPRFKGYVIQWISNSNEAKNKFNKTPEPNSYESGKLPRKN